MARVKIWAESDYLITNYNHLSEAAVANFKNNGIIWISCVDKALRIQIGSQLSRHQWVNAPGKEIWLQWWFIRTETSLRWLFLTLNSSFWITWFFNLYAHTHFSFLTNHPTNLSRKKKSNFKTWRMSFRRICDTLEYDSSFISLSKKWDCFYSILHHYKQITCVNILNVHIFNQTVGHLFVEINRRFHHIYWISIFFLL